jgi:hypothetical protein
MKQIILICFLIATLSSCGSGDTAKTVNDAKQVQSDLKKIQPGGNSYNQRRLDNDG